MADPITTVKNDLTWVKGHIFLLVVVMILVFVGVFGILNVLEKHDKERATELQQILAAQTQQTQILTTKLTQDEANWSVENAANRQLISTLAQSITKRDSALANQAKTNATLSAEAASQRLTQQTAAGPGEIAAQGDTVTMDLPVTRQVVQLLDTLPVVQADLADTQKQLGAETVVATNLQANLTEQKDLVGSLQTQNTDQVKACAAQVKDLKAQARKGKAKWFGIGFISGFLFHFVAGV